MTLDELKQVAGTRTGVEVECEACGCIVGGDDENEILAELESWVVVDDGKGPLPFCDDCKKKLSSREAAERGGDRLSR